MPKVKLTDAACQRLQPPQTGQTEYFDAAYPGLALRVSSRGVRSWVYFGRVNGKLKRATLGRYGKDAPALSLAAARRRAGEVEQEMAAGVDPAKAKREARREADRDLIETVVAEWLKRDQAGNRSHDDVKRLIERNVLPKWRGRKIQQISRRDAVELIDNIADRGAMTLARRTHAHLHRLFRWSVARGIIEVNPMADLPKPGKEVRRDRVLSDAELAEVWAATDAIGWPFGPAIQLLILTGARRNEIAALTWDEVDCAEALIRLEGARTKNGEPRTIPLSPEALALLEQLPKVEPVKGAPAYVFTTTGRTPASGWPRAKRRIDDLIAKAREKRAEETGSEAAVMPGWRIHDLRRTVATGMQRLGERLEVIEAVLGHISGSRAGIVGVYQRHAFEPEKRLALKAWAKHVNPLNRETPAS